MKGGRAIRATPQIATGIMRISTQWSFSFKNIHPNRHVQIIKVEPKATASPIGSRTYDLNPVITQATTLRPYNNKTGTFLKISDLGNCLLYLNSVNSCRSVDPCLPVLADWYQNDRLNNHSRKSHFNSSQTWNLFHYQALKCMNEWWRHSDTKYEKLLFVDHI